MSTAVAGILVVSACILAGCAEPTQPAASHPASVMTPSTRAPNTVTDLGTLGGSTALAWRVNERGQVVGWATKATGETRAFFWTAQRGMTDLGVLPGGNGSVAWGLNDNGAVVGEIDLPSGHVRAFLWTASTGMRDLGTLGGDDALAQGINNSGEVVGYSTLPGDGTTHGFTWTARGGMKDAGTYNGANTRLRSVTESGITGTGTGQGQAVIWHRATGFQGLGFLPGGSYSYGARINDRGQVAGFGDTDVSSHAFLWTTAKGMVDLGALSGVEGRSEALDINDAGEIVGGTTTQADTANLHAFVWKSGRGMRQLVAPPGDVDDEANGLNESGVIVGYGDLLDGSRHALLWRLGSDGPEERRVQH